MTFFVNGVQRHLSLAIVSKRKRGMRVGERFSDLLPSETKLNFEIDYGFSSFFFVFFFFSFHLLLRFDVRVCVPH